MLPKMPGEDFINSWYPIGIALVMGILFAIRSYFKGTQCGNTERMDGKTVIVTGANCGIGKELVKDMAKRGAKVIMACRDVEKGQATKTDLVNYYKLKEERLKVMKLDLASFKSIREFVAKFKKGHKELHVLFNNAGVMCHPEARTEDGNEIHLQTNYLGSFLLTDLLLETLKSSAPSRIVNTTALAYQLVEFNMEDINWQTREYIAGDAYAQSKMAVILWTQQLGKELEGTNVTTSVVQPGVVNSEAHRHMPFKQSSFIRLSFAPVCWFFMKTCKDGAQTSIYCAIAKEEEGVTGKFYSECLQTEAADNVKSGELNEQLWTVTREMLPAAVESS